MTGRLPMAWLNIHSAKFVVMKRTLLVFFTLIVFCAPSFCQDKTEGLKISWPDNYNWQIGSDQENDSQHLVELVPADQTIDNWKILVTMQTLKGTVNVPIASVPEALMRQAQKTANGAKLTILEKDEKAKTPWILFKIESPSFTNDPTPESQLYYVIQGQTALFINFVAIKNRGLSDDFSNQWKIVFKSSELVYQ
jgi:hypothetical protein